jgi:hypothetical protein
MPQASTARLMVLFTAVSMSTSLAGSFLRVARFSFARTWSASGALVILFLIGLATGWLQSRILARHRTPLRGWMIATALGGLATGFLGNVTAREALSVVGPAAQGKLALWLNTLSWGVTGAACLGTAQALAIWPACWPCASGPARCRTSFARPRTSGRRSPSSTSS